MTHNSDKSYTRYTPLEMKVNTKATFTCPRVDSSRDEISSQDESTRYHSTLLHDALLHDI